MTKTKQTALAGLFIALGIVLPSVLHLTAGSLTRVLLPMHITILMAGMLLGSKYGLLTGITTPLLSALLTGMPPLPAAFAMAGELGTYGFLTGYLFFYKRFNIWFSIIASMSGARLVLGFIYSLLFPLFGLKGVPLWTVLTVSVLEVLPGIIVQFILIPPLIMINKKLYSGGIYNENLL